MRLEKFQKKPIDTLSKITGEYSTVSLNGRIQRRQSSDTDVIHRLKQALSLPWSGNAGCKCRRYR